MIIAPFGQESTAEVEAKKRQAAMDSSLRRLCTPKPCSGRLEVSPEIYRQWKVGGAQRKALLDVLIKAGGDKDPK